jgi:hypothetical protein
MFPYDKQHCELKVSSDVYRDLEVQFKGEIRKIRTGHMKDFTMDHPGDEL